MFLKRRTPEWTWLGALRSRVQMALMADTRHTTSQSKELLLRHKSETININSLSTVVILSTTWFNIKWRCVLPRKPIYRVHNMLRIKGEFSLTFSHWICLIVEPFTRIMTRCYLMSRPLPCYQSRIAVFNERTELFVGARLGICLCHPYSLSKDAELNNHRQPDRRKF